MTTHTVHKRKLVSYLQIIVIFVCSSTVRSFHVAAPSHRSIIRSISHSHHAQPSYTTSRYQPRPYVSSNLPLVSVPRGVSSDTALFASSKADLAAADDDKVFKEDFKRCLLWVLASAGFAGGLAATKGFDSAVEFASGYVLEQSLSVDNLFVFLILFDYFKVAKDKQERVLTYGLAVAVLLRGLFIGIGFVALEQFHDILLLFAGLLLVSSYNILFAGDGDGEDEGEDVAQNPVVQFCRRFFKTTDQFDGDRFFTVQNGVSLATPLFLCLLSVEISDVIFAMDSVPAVFGVTEDPFIVFTSNIFAIASLRSVYGVLSRAVEQLEYLEKAVGVVLGIIAVKMGSEVMGIDLLTPLQSLVVVLGVLGVGVGASLLKSKQQVAS